MQPSNRIRTYELDSGRCFRAFPCHHTTADDATRYRSDAEVDLVFFSQSLHHALHPARALQDAWRILKPGGRIVILDLSRHRFEEARELYADEWLGFSASELEQMLAKPGFVQVQTSVVHKQTEAPHFQTLLAVADKPCAA